MTSKWVQEVYKLVGDDDAWEFIEPKILEIDELLKRAMKVADHELMFDLIKQIDGLGDDVKVMRGVSSVIPVTDEEAERIFNEVEKNGD